MTAEKLDAEIRKGLTEIPDCFHAQRVNLRKFLKDGQEAHLIHFYGEAGDEPPVQSLEYKTLLQPTE
jgi:hypothetical protein